MGEQAPRGGKPEEGLAAIVLIVSICMQTGEGSANPRVMPRIIIMRIPYM
jgi:hypothetical protein